VVKQCDTPVPAVSNRDPDRSHRTLRMRWYFSYVVATVMLIIGLITFLFMIRVL
jgi:hypothetical protein